MRMPLKPTESVVLYADILGFSHLTETSRLDLLLKPPMFPLSGERELIRDLDREDNAVSWATYYFHGFLEGWLRKAAEGGHLTVLSFSDSAFVVLNHPASIATLARQWMRHCLIRKIPVRMGIARGTFIHARFRSDTANQVLIYGAQFFGTGIVRAHAAEHSGKGMRIFVHPSMGDDLRPMSRADRSPVLPIDPPTPNAHWELEYFTDDGGSPFDARRPDEAECVQIYKNVLSMQESALNLPEPARPSARRHYQDTLAAFDRMRDAIRLPRLGP